MIICFRWPIVFKFALSCMGVGCWYDQARYDVRKQSQTGALDDARHNRSEG